MGGSMTQDEIIEMAQEVGMNYLQFLSLESMEKVIHFVNLVEIKAADKATEEANARANASWTLMCNKMVAIEREACAQIADEWSVGDPHLSKIIADAIRARGEQA
jgi:hypothetical protein